MKAAELGADDDGDGNDRTVGVRGSLSRGTVSS
jgi:hypothetical protein